MSRGGLRPGAGRPPKPSGEKYLRGISWKIPPEPAELLDTLAERLGVSRSEVLRRGLAALAAQEEAISAADAGLIRIRTSEPGVREALGLPHWALPASERERRWVKAALRGGADLNTAPTGRTVHLLSYETHSGGNGEYYTLLLYGRGADFVEVTVRG